MRRSLLRACSRALAVALALAPALGFGAAARATGGDEDLRDELRLEGGTALRGRIVLEDPERFVLRLAGAEREVPRAQVTSSKSVFRAQGELLAQYVALARNDAASLLALAAQCRAQDLPHEEQLFYWLALSVDPENQVAHARLGHQQKGGRWLVPMRGGAVSFEKLLELRGTWGKAWELRSEHYAVRSDAGLVEAAAIALELEQFYRAFYGLYQQRLALREVLRPMHVEVHGSERALGEMPPWLAVGWGEYMEGLLTRPAGRRPGVLALHPKRFLEAHRALYERTAAAKRYGLHRVLNFGLSDFDASSGQGQKYAQCYLLFHYLMHAQGDAHQARFFQYLRLAFEGRGQASSFRDLFDADAIERDLEHYQGR